MEVNVSNAQLELAFNLFKGLKQDNLGYIYRGLLTQKLTLSILSLTESSISKFEDVAKVKKKVFFVMMEGLQNITRHQDATRDTTPEKYGIFVFQKRASRYYITTGNLIDNDKIEPLIKQLDKINSLSSKELKEYKKEVLITTRIRESGGAGLGLIEMARKSGRKLIYDFKDINDKYSYFYLHIDIPFIEESAEQAKKADKEFSITHIKELHEAFNRENILLNFSGTFTQDNLMDLLSIFEGQMKGRIMLKKKVFNIMVEMLQNLVKHADPFDDDEEGKPGIFFISEKKQIFFINCGNYIKNHEIDELKKRIDFANSMSLIECNDYYNKILSSFNIDEPTTSGLGIIDMRLKSENLLHYKINKVDDTYSFFTLQTCV